MRNRVDSVRQATVEARRAGDSYVASLYRVRLEDLLDLAERTDVDTTGWADPAQVTSTDKSTVDQG